MRDHVVQALVSAVADMETLSGPPYDLREAGNALEDVGYYLSQMGPDERQQFLDAVDRLAAQEEEPAMADWIRRLPVAFGLTRKGD